MTYQRYDIVRIFCEHHVKPNVRRVHPRSGNTVLYFASVHGSVPIAELIMARYPRPSILQKNDIGISPLSGARSDRMKSYLGSYVRKIKNRRKNIIRILETSTGVARVLAALIFEYMEDI